MWARNQAGSLLLGLLLVLAGSVAAQEVQTPSATLSEELQTASATLETVIVVVESNPFVPEKHAQLLLALLLTSLQEGTLTPEQALEFLEAVEWSELGDEDAVGFAVRALELALIAITAEESPYDEVLAALLEMAESGELGPLVSGAHATNALPGLITALSNSTQELTPTLLAAIERAILAGAPPGQVLQLVKSLIRAGAEESEIIEAVETLSPHGHQGENPPGEGGCRGCSEEHGPPSDHGKPRHTEDEEESEHGRGHGRGKSG